MSEYDRALDQLVQQFGPAEELERTLLKRAMESDLYPVQDKLRYIKVVHCPCRDSVSYRVDCPHGIFIPPEVYTSPAKDGVSVAGVDDRQDESTDA